MTNNPTKRGNIYEKIAMRVGDDERLINYEWPYMCKMSSSEMLGCFNLSEFFRTWSGFCCLDSTGNIPALFLSRQSNFHFCKIFCLDNMHMLFEFFFVRALFSESSCLRVFLFFEFYLSFFEYFCSTTI